MTNKDKELLEKIINDNIKCLEYKYIEQLAEAILSVGLKKENDEEAYKRGWERGRLLGQREGIEQATILQGKPFAGGHLGEVKLQPIDGLTECIEAMSIPYECGQENHDIIWCPYCEAREDGYEFAKREMLQIVKNFGEVKAELKLKGYVIRKIDDEHIWIEQDGGEGMGAEINTLYKNNF